MEKLAEILGVPKKKLEELEDVMQNAGFSAPGGPATGGEPALEKIAAQNERLVERALGDLGLGKGATAEEAVEALSKKAEEDDKELYEFLGIERDNIDFEKVAAAARDIATESKGFFLKKEYGEQILREREPEAILDHLGYKDIDELLQKEDITEIFSALRFTETDEWMHKTFEVTYTKFTPNDFERRPIELKVLGSQWAEIAKKYVAKKHHNVSHLKEFGVIFLNPIAQSGKGKFVRDFALLLHYFHEIAFYSKLFQKYAVLPDFNQKFISLLRGDVPEIKGDSELFNSARGKWLIVQRYLWKENPQDARLFLPHVNPESMHWRKAEEDIIAFGKNQVAVHIEFWDQLWSVAGFFPDRNGGHQLVSFDLEDNAMMVAHKAEGKDVRLTYHQHEAMWNRIFAQYVGGYEKLEEYVVENMGKGVISF